MKRRHFLISSVIGSLGVRQAFSKPGPINSTSGLMENAGPVSIATWNFQNATAKAGLMLDNGASALDAVEQGVRVEESNIKNTTVGNGGYPDRNGNVTLDASIMAPNGDAGSVIYLKDIQHPVSVARKIMEESPHVMLAGEGAFHFAITKGFERKDLLSQESKEAWRKWMKEKKYKPIINIENHDTIGMLCMDKNNDIAGACTTSGLAFKMNGRVGDSPIIGSGLFVDNEVGGAVATGLGEAIMKNIKGNGNYKEFQVGLLAMNKAGKIGAYSIHSGFTYAKTQNNLNFNVASSYYNK